MRYLQAITLAAMLAITAMSCAETYGTSQSELSTCDHIWEGYCVDESEDFSEILQAVIDSKPLFQQHYGQLSPPKTITLPFEATLKLDSRVVIDRPIRLVGNGSQLVVADGITALYLTSPIPNDGGADYSVLQDLWMRGSGVANESIAIDIRRHGVRVNNATCFTMGTCYKVRGQYNEDGGNANATRMTDLVARSCKTAFDVSGGDAQVGLFTGLEILGCENGVIDSSAFGNVWVGVSTEGTVGPGFMMDKDSTYATVVGGYQESGEHLAHIRGRSSIVVGGNLPLYLDEDSQADRVGYQLASLRFQRNGGPSVKIPGLESGDVMSWNWQSGTSSNGVPVAQPQEFRLTWDEQMLGWSFWHFGPRDGLPQEWWHGSRGYTLLGANGANGAAGGLWLHRVESP